MRTEKISSRSMTVLVGCFLTTSVLISLPSAMMRQASQDAWVSPFFAMFYGLVVCFMLLIHCREKTLFEANREVLGVAVGNIVNIFLLLYLLQLLSMDLRMVGEFIKVTLLPTTPYQVIMFCIMLLAVYLVRSGIEVIVRVSMLYFLLLVLVILSTPLLVLNEISVQNLQPMLANGLSPILAGSYVSVGRLGELIVCGTFLVNMTKGSERGVHPLFRGLVFSIFLFTISMVIIVFVVGTTIGSKSVYPGFILAQQIHITEFLDRVDITIVALWLPSFLSKLALVYYALCECAANIGRNRQDRRAFLLVLLPLVGAGSEFLFDNISELLDFEAYIWPFESIFFHLPLLLLLSLVKWMRSAGRKNGIGQVGEVRFWLLIALTGGSVVAGTQLGWKAGWYGMLFAAVFMLLFVCLLLLSFKGEWPGFGGNRRHTEEEQS